MRRNASVTVIAAAALALAACGGAGAGGAGDALEGTWTLASGHGPDGPVTVPEKAQATLVIDGDEWGGQLCNHYFAEAHVRGQEVTLTGIGGTEMGCEEPLMTAEQRYYAALGDVTAWEIVDDRLRLTGPDTELVYDPVAPTPDADLVGTDWVLDGLVHGSGPDGAVSSVLETPTLVLAEDGSLEAFTGCNTVTGRYELDGEVLRTDELIQTDAGCDAALMEQEEHVIAVLGADPRVEIDGARLTLTADDLGLVYRAADT